MSAGVRGWAPRGMRTHERQARLAGGVAAGGALVGVFVAQHRTVLIIQHPLVASHLLAHQLLCQPLVVLLAAQDQVRKVRTAKDAEEQVLPRPCRRGRGGAQGRHRHGRARVRRGGVQGEREGTAGRAQQQRQRKAHAGPGGGAREKSGCFRSARVYMKTPTPFVAPTIVAINPIGARAAFEPAAWQSPEHSKAGCTGYSEWCLLTLVLPRTSNNNNLPDLVHLSRAFEKPGPPVSLASFLSRITPSAGTFLAFLARGRGDRRRTAPTTTSSSSRGAAGKNYTF